MAPLGGRHPWRRRCRTRSRRRAGYERFRRRKVRERIPQHGRPRVRQEPSVRGIAILCRFALHHCRARTGLPGDRRQARRPRQQSREARRPSQANQENRLAPLGGRHPWRRRCRNRGRRQTGYKRFRRRERAREFRNTGGRASDRKRRYAKSRSFAGSHCIIAEHGRGHPATEDKPAGRVSKVGKLVGQARQIRKIDWRRWAVDIRGGDAVGLEIGVGAVTSGFAEGKHAREFRDTGRPRVRQEASLRGMHYCRPRMGPPGNRRQAHRPRQQSREARRPSQANQENRLVPLGGRRPRCRRCRTRSRRRAGYGRFCRRGWRKKTSIQTGFEKSCRFAEGASPYISHHLCMIGQICGEACWFFCRRGTPWRRQTREVLERYLAAKAAKGSRWASG